MRAIDAAGAAEAAITDANVAQHDALAAYKVAAMKGGPGPPACMCVETCCPSLVPFTCCFNKWVTDASMVMSLCCVIVRTSH